MVDVFQFFSMSDNRIGAYDLVITSWDDIT